MNELIYKFLYKPYNQMFVDILYWSEIIFYFRVDIFFFIVCGVSIMISNIILSRYVHIIQHIKKSLNHFDLHRLMWKYYPLS